MDTPENEYIPQDTIISEKTTVIITVRILLVELLIVIITSMNYSSSRRANA
jgi:hypothetical protein